MEMPLFHESRTALIVISIILTFVFTIGYHFVLKANNPVEGNE